MRYIMFQPNETYSIALLVKPGALNSRELSRYYVTGLLERGVPEEEVLAVAVDTDMGKVTATMAKAWLAQVLPHLKEQGVTTLFVAESTYFKVLTKQAKAEPHYGYVLPAKLAGYEGFNVVLGLSYQQLIYQPALQSRMDLSLTAVAGAFTQSYTPPGDGIIHQAQYPDTPFEIAQALSELHNHALITCDIEAFSLKFYEAGVGTIAFGISEHEGVAFACDYDPVIDPDLSPVDGPVLLGRQRPNADVRRLLRTFFEAYTGTVIWHGSSYDLKALIFALWMTDLADTAGQQRGLEVMTRRFEDTRLIAYLATNSCAGNTLSLKHLAHEFAGNWAIEEIGDIRTIPLPKLLQYNLVDALSTRWVYDRYRPRMEADEQLDLYTGLFLPNQKLNIAKEMTGMPMSRRAIAALREELETKVNGLRAVLSANTYVRQLEVMQTRLAWMDDLSRRRAKAKHPEKIVAKDFETFPLQTYNPNSGPQNQRLLYLIMKLPVIDLTDTKQPATGGDTLKKLMAFVTTPDRTEVLQTLADFVDAEKILTGFLPAFEQAVPKRTNLAGQGDDDVVWLFGNFKIGGTVSGRESSAEPSLQNLPANSTYAQAVKRCFISSEDWIFGGADYKSLEDMINALLTRDPNKLKVYEGTPVFEIVIDGQTHHLREDSTLIYNNETLTVGEWHERWQTDCRL